MTPEGTQNSSAQGPEKPPKFNQALVNERRDNVLNSLDVLAFVGTTPTGENFDRFINAITAALPDGVPQANVYDSLMHLAGQEITPHGLTAEIWRLAANFNRLKRRPVTPWQRQAAFEWVPALVQRVDRRYNHFGKLGATITFLITGGTPVALSIEKFWTKKFGAVVAARLGFSRPWGMMPYRDLAEFYGMELSLRLAPQLCRGTPDFDRVAVTAAQQKTNQVLLSLRARNKPEEFDCPEGFLSSFPCHRCVFGADRCQAATHDFTYEKRWCEGCQQDSWFNPDFPQRDVCIDCYNQRLSQKRLC